jgi:alkanesulfonate monooxygenase SsuD/methylene tetrahydromethanopterin reductase-like flavin-dependent oxidoreductase (luciferase family)
MIGLNPSGGFHARYTTARMPATLDRLSSGRVLINRAAGGNLEEMHGDGVWFGHGGRRTATAGYLTVWRQLMQGDRLLILMATTGAWRSASCSARRSGSPVRRYASAARPMLARRSRRSTATSILPGRRGRSRYAPELIRNPGAGSM